MTRGGRRAQPDGGPHCRALEGHEFVIRPRRQGSVVFGLHLPQRLHLRRQLGWCECATDLASGGEAHALRLEEQFAGSVHRSGSVLARRRRCLYRVEQGPYGRRDQHGTGRGTDQRLALPLREQGHAAHESARARADRLEREQTFEVVGELGCGGVALLGIGLHRLAEHGLEVARDVRRALAKRHDDAVLDLAQHFLGTAALIGRRQRDRFVERRAEAVDVGATVEAEVAVAQTLGRGVGRRARERAGLRDREVAIARESEVGEHRRAVGSQQDVGRLHVAVHEALAVDLGECATDRDAEFDEVLDRAPDRQVRGLLAERGDQVGRLRLRTLRAQGREQRLQTRSVDELHLERQHLAVVDDAMDVDDVVVAQARQRPRFVEESAFGAR